MSFFNQKEEVIDLKLTPHGRYLFSLGKLDPIYYAFYDDDIIYDLRYVTGSLTDQGGVFQGSPERHDDTEERIEHKTPRSHNQYTFRERKPNLVQYEGVGYLQNTHEKEHGLVGTLGTCDTSTQFAPAWDVQLRKGLIERSTQIYSGSGPFYRIPQLECQDIQYATVLGNKTSTTGPDPTFPEAERIVTTFPDSSLLEIREDFILLEINEANVTFEKENFEIEVFEVLEETDRAGNITETLTPLYFSSGVGEPKTNEVEYYLNISVDSNIDLIKLCKYQGSDRTDNTFLPPIFDCRALGEDFFSEELVSQYGTTVSEENIGEICLEDC